MDSSFEVELNDKTELVVISGPVRPIIIFYSLF